MTITGAVSRASLAEAKERLEAVISSAGPDLDGLGGDLFAVLHLIDREHGLRRAVSDPARDGADKAQLVRILLEGKVSPAALGLVADVVRMRWSTPSELSDAVEALAVTAESARAEAAGRLDDLEDELFRFGRIVESNAGLSLALSDLSVPAARKRGLIERLLEGRANVVTLRLVQRAVTRGEKGRAVDRVIDELVALAAERRQRKVAVVQVAQPLDAEQVDRLRAALSRTFGGEVELRIEVVPDVLGGVVVQVGDEVVDGSVARRLAEAQRLLGR